TMPAALAPLTPGRSRRSLANSASSVSSISSVRTSCPGASTVCNSDFLLVMALVSLLKADETPRRRGVSESGNETPGLSRHAVEQRAADRDDGRVDKNECSDV